MRLYTSTRVKIHRAVALAASRAGALEERIEEVSSLPGPLACAGVRGASDPLLLLVA